MTLSNPDFLATQTYTAMQLRGLTMDIGVQQGVLDAFDLKVLQRQLGPNMSVDIWPGAVFVKGTSTARQGLYHAYNNADVNLVIGANSSGNPRIDQVVARVYDATDGASVTNTIALEVIAGTPTVGATLANRSGAAVLPAHSMRLADVLVANGAASILDASIKDRRTFAGGAYARIVRTQNEAAGSDYTTASTTMVNIDATNLAPQMEMGNSGRARARFTAIMRHSVAGGSITFGWALNGSQYEQLPVAWNCPNTSYVAPLDSSYDFVVAPNGIFRINPLWKTSGATATLLAGAANQVTLVIEELVGRGGDNFTSATP